MSESSNTTSRNLDSQISFYEYPPHQPFVNTIYPSLKSTSNLSESNRDQFLSSLQSLSLKIQILENQRKKAELTFHEITGKSLRSLSNGQDSTMNNDVQIIELKQDFHRYQIPTVLPSSAGRKSKSIAQHHHYFDSSSSKTITQGKPHHSQINPIPFILGQSTSQSHNVKSNVQNVFALLKHHNHQLCLSSKEYSNLRHPRHERELSPHQLLYLDHYKKSSQRSSSLSPIRSTHHRQSRSTIDRQYYSTRKQQQKEYILPSRQHNKFNSLERNSDDIQCLNERMQMGLEELEYLQMLSQNHIEQESNETLADTSGRTKLLQLILRDSINAQQ